MQKTLTEMVKENPFEEFTPWWQVGNEFVSFMSEAIYSEWKKLAQSEGQLKLIQEYTAHYLLTVYSERQKADLVDRFVVRTLSEPFNSGEFDALSYAFFRSAFELIAAHPNRYQHGVERERRLFTKRVGKKFFSQVNDFLKLTIPKSLETASDFDLLKDCLESIGGFLTSQGYLRDHFAFHFNVMVELNGRAIAQKTDHFLEYLKHQGTGYALYEMGYPIILPSAVYLYHTIGEAQHHSSRTIEELFALLGYEARETDDFDPSDYPADRVVELWEIRKLG